MSVIPISGVNRRNEQRRDGDGPTLDGSDEVFAANSELANARLALGLSVDAVAEELNLAPDQILALERGDYGGFPGLVYLKGYLRNYARFVGVDPDRVVSNLQREEETEPVSAPIQTAPYRYVQHRSHRAGRILFPAILIACGLLVIGFGWLVFSKQIGINLPSIGKSETAAPAIESETPSSEGLKLEILPQDASDSGALTTAGAAAPDSTASTGLPSGIPITSGETAAPASVSNSNVANDVLAATGITLQIDDKKSSADTAASPSTDSTAQSSNQSGANQSAAATTPAAAAQPATDTALVPATAGSSLVLRGVATGWVEVRDGDGTSLFEDNLNKGQILEFQSEPPFNLVLGDASAVVVIRNGAVVDTSPFTRGKVARFLINPDSIVRASE